MPGVLKDGCMGAGGTGKADTAAGSVSDCRVSDLPHGHRGRCFAF